MKLDKYPTPRPPPRLSQLDQLARQLASGLVPQLPGLKLDELATDVPTEPSQ